MDNLRKDYYRNTRIVVDKMLELFTKYDIHVTWATVGLLFFNSKQELLTTLPKKQPQYDKPELSAYNYIENSFIGDNEESDPFHFGLSLLKKIKEAPHQEIATHTFSHYYCNEPGQTVETFKEDINSAIIMGKELGVEIKSLVFSRNQFNQEYLMACKELGIEAIRTNPSVWWWKIDTHVESKWKRLNRGLDAYFKLDSNTTFKLSNLSKDAPVKIPASRLLRSWSSKFKFLNKLRLDRIKREMNTAAMKKEAYHLWWHPHNFGWHPENNLNDLEELLLHFTSLKKKYGMQSLTMREVAEVVNKNI